MTKLSDVAELIMGQSPPSTTYNENSDGLPFFQGKTDFGFRHPSPKSFCNAPLKIAKPHDILISVRAPVGPTNIANQECCIGRGLAAIRPRNIDGHFLFFNLRYLEKYIASLGTGSTFHAINKAQLASIDVNEHGFSVEEQRKIAAVLGTVQQAIEGQERLLQLITELKKSLLRKLFTKGLRGEPQKMTEIGPVPESWEVVRLGDVCSLSTGTTPSTACASYYNGDVPFIRTTDIVNNRIAQAQSHISREAVTDCNLKIYQSGTVLMAMYGQGKTRGQVSILEISAATTQNAAAIQPSQKIDSEFLWQYLMSRYDELRGAGAQGHISHLNLGYVRDFLIVRPPLSIQREIVEILAVIDRRVTLAESKRLLLQDLFRTLLHQLMTAQIRVNDLDLNGLESLTTKD